MQKQQTINCFFRQLSSVDLHRVAL